MTNVTNLQYDVQHRLDELARTDLGLQVAVYQTRTARRRRPCGMS